MLVMYNVMYTTNIEARRRAMSVTQINIDDEALERAVALSHAKTKREAVNVALRYYVERKERAARIGRHFDRARHWGAVQDAARQHQREKDER
jgi:Arc/MetJ family transcription regulator